MINRTNKSVSKTIEVCIWPTTNRAVMRTHESSYHSFNSQIVDARMQIQYRFTVSLLTLRLLYCSFADYTFKYHRVDLIHPEKPCSHFGTYAVKGKQLCHVITKENNRQKCYQHRDLNHAHYKLSLTTRQVTRRGISSTLSRSYQVILSCTTIVEPRDAFQLVRP